VVVTDGSRSVAGRFDGRKQFRPYAHPDPRAPHHCAFVDAPFGDGQLRVDCPDQTPAEAGQEEENCRRFAGAGPLQAAEGAGAR
jgi:hypothetical protein